MSLLTGRFAELWRGCGAKLGIGRRASARLPDLATQDALRDSEERLRLVRRATGLGMYEIDWLARRRYWSPELRAILRVPEDLDIDTDTDLLERIIPDEMRGAFRAKLATSLDPATGGDYDDEHRIVRFDGTPGWILLRGKTFFGEGPGRRVPTRSIGLIVDITDRKRGEEANALHASTVLSSNDAIFSIDPRQIIRTWNPGAERLYGYSAWDAIGQPLSILHDQDHLPEFGDLFARTMSGEAVILETLRRHKDGRMIPVSIGGSPIFDADGKVAGVAAVHRDMTERRRHEEHLGFTLRELSHRTKNMLAVVQGLSHMIARRSDGIADFETRFHGCIQALAYSHDLLVQNEWQGATLEELLRVQLAPFGGLEGGRFALHGARVNLRPQVMQSLGLILHELATNATKHGALSNSTGIVAIDWTREGSAGGPSVQLVWQERGGPPVSPPTREGFGRVVLGRTGASLEGGLTTEFLPEGLRCTIRIGRGNLQD